MFFSDFENFFEKTQFFNHKYKKPIVMSVCLFRDRDYLQDAEADWYAVFF